MPESPQTQPTDEKGEKTPEAATAPRRRQARGERRIAQLLQAAAGVFCRTGYAAASTNAIAREAGVSPGTLYQFFPNKEAIAVELGAGCCTTRTRRTARPSCRRTCTSRCPS